MTGAAAAGVGVASSEALAQGSRSTGKQVIELRRYTFASAEKRTAFEAFIGAGLLPALNRAGIRPVGAFQLRKADNPMAAFPGEIGPDLYLLIPHPGLDSVTTLDSRLAADGAYAEEQKKLAEQPREPAYARIEISLFLGFDDCPRVEVPAKGPGRVLQLRIYEAMNDERGRMKVHMFNQGGEIKLFREVGLHPVFFGHAVAGPLMPNLTYMLGFDSPAALAAAWDRFRPHPAWQKLSRDPLYKDTVSRITNLILRPLPTSQI